MSPRSRPPAPNLDPHAAALLELARGGLLAPEALRMAPGRDPQRVRGKEEMLALLADRLASRAPLLVTTAFLRNLKAINTIYGHQVGDAAQGLARAIIEAVLLELDPAATFAQLMGSHWVILHEDPHGPVAERIARRVNDAIAASVLSSSGRTVRPHPLVASVEIPADAGYATADLLKVLDLAAARAERSGTSPLLIGRGREQAFALLDLSARERGVNAITRALAENRIEIHVQPVIDLKTDRLYDGEALARIHTNGHVMEATEFIDAIYDLGDVVELDTQVLGRIRESAAKLAGVTDRLFINVSPLSLASPAFLSVMRDTIEDLQRDGIGISIVLELTEQALLENESAVRDINRDYGVTFAVDDFGTGYSSLKTVSDLAVSRVISYLKIDGSLTRQLPISDEAYKVVLAIVNLAKSLGIKVVAEHVENDAILARLRTTGVEFAQGHVFSPALPVDELAARYPGQRRLEAPAFSPAQLHVLEPYLDKAFNAFYDSLLSDEHFALFFANPEQVRHLVERQRDTFLRSLHDDPERLRARYTELGRLHHDLLLPFPSFMRGADILNQELLEVLANVTAGGEMIKNTLSFFDRIKRYISRGYLERILREDRERVALLRSVVNATPGLVHGQAGLLFACLDGVLDAIELDRPALVPPADPAQCPVHGWIDDASREDALALDATRLHELHRALHVGAGNLAFFLSCADYTSVLLIYRTLSGRFLMLLSLLVADAARTELGAVARRGLDLPPPLA